MLDRTRGRPKNGGKEKKNPTTKCQKKKDKAGGTRKDSAEEGWGRRVRKHVTRKLDKGGFTELGGKKGAQRKEKGKKKVALHGG